MLEQTRRNLEITVLDLIINYNIPAHFKKDCLLNNSIKSIKKIKIIKKNNEKRKNLNKSFVKY